MGFHNRRAMFSRTLRAEIIVRSGLTEPVCDVSTAAFWFIDYSSLRNNRAPFIFEAESSLWRYHPYYHVSLALFLWPVFSHDRDSGCSVTLF